MTTCRRLLEGTLATNKSCDKGEFDWGVYKKALRRLTPAQEEALSGGTLRPLLDYVLAEPEVRLDIRPNAANIYYDGGSLLQLKNGTRLPFTGTFSRGYIGEKDYEESLLRCLADSEHEVQGFEKRRWQMREHDGEGYKRAERRIQQSIARANGGQSLVEAADLHRHRHRVRKRPTQVRPRALRSQPTTTAEAHLLRAQVP